MILKETILSAFNERGTLLKWLKTVERLITERVLVKPVNNPQSTEIVAIDITGTQVMLKVGEGLTIENGVLKIQKANSVLGLRKIKDSWFTNYIANVGEFDKSSQTEMQNVYNQYGFEIEPTALTLNEITATLLGLTATFAYIESDVLPNTTTWVGKINLNGAEMYVTTDDSTFTDILTQFTVTATANSTVDEWLLANTESVEV